MSDVLRYAGFWSRLYANLIDSIVNVPLVVLGWPGMLSREASIVAAVPLFVVGAGYNVVMHARWGQTLGKMEAGIKVLTVDCDPIGWRRAMLRNSVEVGFGIISTAATIVTLLHLPASTFSLDWRQQAEAHTNALPAWGRHAGTLAGLWFWSELLVLLFNRKRRALHDFIAGTIVVRVAD